MNPINFLLLFSPMTPLMGMINAIQANGWDYNPVTEWFEKAFDGWLSLFHVDINYPGRPKLETWITESIASPERQIGIIIDAVCELGKGSPGNDLKRLYNLKEQIDKIKDTYYMMPPTTQSQLRPLHPI